MQALATVLVACATLVSAPQAQAEGRRDIRVVNANAYTSLLLGTPVQEPASASQNGARKKGAKDDDLVVKLDTLQEYIGSKYRVGANGLRPVLEAAWQVGGTMQLDPLLLLAVMAIESSFDPRAESGKGAQGLMQVMTRIHRDKFAPFGGTKAAWHPEANIQVGAQILRDCIERRGSVPGGLTCYVGSPGTASAYGRKVLAERDRLRAALLPERAGTAVAEAAPAQQRQRTAAAKPQAERVRVVANAPAPRPTTLGEAARDGDISNEPIDVTASLTMRDLSALEM